MTVERLLREMSSAELTEWQAFARLEAEDRKQARQDRNAMEAARSAKRARKKG